MQSSCSLIFMLLYTLLSDPFLKQIFVTKKLRNICSLEKKSFLMLALKKDKKEGFSLITFS